MAEKAYVCHQTGLKTYQLKNETVSKIRGKTNENNAMIEKRR